MELLTVEEVADRLRVKPSFVRAEIAKGNMPHTRLGTRKYLRVSPAQLTAYLESKTSDGVQ